MTDMAYCPECRWRTRHKRGVCVECAPDEPPVVACPETGDLFAPHNGTRTSRAAAESVDIGDVKTQRRRIMLFVLEQGDATRDEIEAALDIAGDAVRPRCVRLQEDGWLEPKGKVERLTRKGRRAQVYQPTRKALEWYAQPRHWRAA